MGNGEWGMVNGEWRMENGELRGGRRGEAQIISGRSKESRRTMPCIHLSFTLCLLPSAFLKTRK